MLYYVYNFNVQKSTVELSTHLNKSSTCGFLATANFAILTNNPNIFYNVLF